IQFFRPPTEAYSTVGKASTAGTIVSADKPISYLTSRTWISVHSSTSPPNAVTGPGYAHMKLPPAYTVGHTYVAGPFVTRLPSMAAESIVYRIAALANSTKVVLSPPVANVPILSKGEVFDFETSAAFAARSQDEAHPFQLGQVMPSAKGSWH